MQSQLAPLRVLIVGGGMGGLALANGLLRLNNPVNATHRPVNFTIFERDESYTGRNQGYKLGLQQMGTDALRDLGCRGISPLLESETAITGMRMSKATRQGISTLLQFPVGDGGGIIDRRLLRKELAAAVTDYIKWDHQFTGFTIDESEKKEGDNKESVVTAHFADGKSYSGDLLIGADGAKSAVRTTLYPSLTTDKFMMDTNVNTFAFHLNVSRLRELRNPAVDNLIDHANHTLLRILGPGAFSWLVMIAKESYGPETGDEKIIMVFNHNNKIEGEFVDPDPNEWLRFVLSKVDEKAVGGGCLPLREIIRILTPEDIILGGPKRIFTSRPEVVANLHKTPLSSIAAGSHVALLGDAAHPMTTHRGLGANTAFQDALALYNVIEEASREGKISDATLAEYNKELSARGAKAVSGSLGSTTMMHLGSQWQRSARDLVISGVGKGLSLYQNFKRNK